MHEIVVNLHMHTRYSDGHVTHRQIVETALRVGLDAVIVTDHNVWVNGPEDVYEAEGRRLLLLIGEEIHDQARLPQKSHLMVIGAGRELAPLAYDLPRLLEAARQAGALTFLAHPRDPASPAVGEDDLSWDDWHLSGYTGLELWNAMSEFKSLLKTKLHAIYYAYNPSRVAHGPFPEVLQKWDALLAGGQRVVAVGGTDAHALPVRLGPLRRVIFPFDFHFRTVNNHLLIPKPLTGELEADRRLVLEALAQGRGWIGYDLPAATRGFSFTAQGKERTAQMGEEMPVQEGVTIQVRLPRPAECRLLRDGQPVKVWQKQQSGVYITNQPGVYRVEAYLHFKGKRRGWIFSNPIFLTPSKGAG